MRRALSLRLPGACVLLVLSRFPDEYARSSQNVGCTRDTAAHTGLGAQLRNSATLVGHEDLRRKQVNQHVERAFVAKNEQVLAPALQWRGQICVIDFGTRTPAVFY